jgi:hypothetical protein
MGMAKRHVITSLDENHKLVREELEKPTSLKVLHKIEVKEEDSKFPIKAALSIRDQIMDLPIRVGNEAVIIVDDKNALIEILSICFLQRRFNECISISVRRESGEFLIPYIAFLHSSPEDKRELLVDYNYSCGSCSGSCSSCG